VLRLSAGGDEALSLRSLAKDAGVSAAAPYHHFGSKEGLLAAIAADGFARLDAALAAAAVDDPNVSLTDMADRYVRFALAHAAHYRHMWSPSLGTGAFPALETQAIACFSRLVGAVARVRSDLDEGACVKRAALAWSLSHGFVMLSLDGVWGDLASDVDALTDDVAAAVLRVVL